MSKKNFDEKKVCQKKFQLKTIVLPKENFVKKNFHQNFFLSKT